MPKTPAQFEKIRIDRKAAILDAALHVFAEEGYHSASISKVSRYAGVSKGLMYNYFDSKADLLDKLLGDILDAEVKVTIDLMKTEFTESSFIKFINHNLEILKERPKQWKLYFSMATQPEVLKIVEKRFAKEQVECTEKILSFFIKKGCEKPMLQMQYFFTTYGGLKMQYIFNPENCPIDELKELIINQFIKS